MTEPKFEIQPYLSRAQALTITTPADAQLATDRIGEIRHMMEEITSTFGPIKKKAHDAHKEACAAETKYLKPLQEAEGVYRAKMLAFADQQQELIRLENERLVREAQAKAEAEKAIELAAAKEEAARLKHERDRLVDEGNEAAAHEAEQKRQLAAKAAREIAKTEAIAAPVVVMEAPKIQGQSISQVWKFEIVDKKLVPEHFKVVDEVALGKVVRATSGAIPIPGVSIYQATQLRVGR